MTVTVETMRNENSGVTPKLRTYGQIRGVTLSRETHANGGVTLDLSSPTMAIATHTHGYYVSGLHKPHMFNLADSDTRDYQFALGMAYAATDGLGLMGTWVESGVVYAEASEWFEDYEMAILVAKEREQLAVWDVANKVSIYIG
jgi:hypothetical protein